MTARNLYEYAQTELGNEGSPNLLLNDFNYYANKTINQYVNKRYNIYDINQQTTDDLRVLKSNAEINITEANRVKSMDDLTTTGQMATYCFDLPSDYLHMLNCICVYDVNKTYKCFNKRKSGYRASATRLTSDMYSQVLDNFWNKPSYEKPYYYIHNINTEENNPYNPYTEKEGTDYNKTDYNKQFPSSAEEINNFIDNLNFNYEVNKISDGTTDGLVLEALDDNPSIIDGTDKKVLNDGEYVLYKDRHCYNEDGEEITPSETQLPYSEQITKVIYVIRAKSLSNHTKKVAVPIIQLICDIDYQSWTQMIDFNVSEESELQNFYRNFLSSEDGFGTTVLDTSDNNIFGTIKLGEQEYSNRERSGGLRYGNASAVRCEIRYGTDISIFQLSKVLIDYIKVPQFICLTQEQLDYTEDKSQVLEFPDYVCQEILNELVHAIMERGANPRLQTHPVVSQSIANPTQAQAPETAG